ncbi:MAG: 4Fe-4S binding protein [Acidobacteria bacterium]|nr:4Fe-4S binding protein [Acidobacteriota bacterium]
MATATQTQQGFVPVEALEKPWRFDLFRRWPWLKRLVRMRSFQYFLLLPNLFMFYLFLIAGLFGTPVGSSNIIIMYVWILWWFVLIAVMMPFGSRIWCTMCPLPFFGDWLQRGAVIKVRSGKSPGTNNKFFGLHKRWPKKLSNIWLQNFGFLLLATFSALLVTRPIVSVIVFGIMIVVATGLALIYRLRTFCNYVCPISGFLSLYAMTATLELRSTDKDECLKCTTKSCIRGSEDGWACPWNVYMGKLDRNNYCGLCFECVKSCPNDNISLFVRPFATSDVVIRGYDEVWKASIMLVLAFSYSVVLLGPYGQLKDWANISEVGNWGGFGLYAAGQALLALVVFPGLYYLSIRLAKWYAKIDNVSTKELFLRYAYMLVPMGLLAWIAFSVPLIMINGSYIISVTSDPLGWGMDLFGTAHFPWTPFWPEWVPFIQVPILLAGFYYGVRGIHKVGRQLFSDPVQLHRSLVPPTALLLGVTLVFMKLFIG